MERKREIEFDILRILALFAVICVHVGSNEMDVLPTTNIYHQIFIFIKSILTWQIPIYVMISGRFFLDPERNVSVNKLLKSVVRLLIAFFVWNIVYQIYYISSESYADLNWKGVLSQALIGPYHFWYLYMIIGLYIITPFLRKIAESKNLMKYFICLFWVFGFLTTYGSSMPIIGSIISEMLGNINFHFAIGFSGYYILGYYLYRYGISAKIEKPLYFMGILLCIITGIANVFRSMNEGYNGEWYSQYLLPNVAIEAVAIYVFVIKRIGKVKFSDKIKKIITKMSLNSFGVYLIHALVLEWIAAINITPIMTNPIVMVPLIAMMTFLITNICVELIRRIPIIGEKII